MYGWYGGARAATRGPYAGGAIALRGDRRAGLAAVPARADLRLDVGHARRLPGLRARLRPRRPGSLHGGDVRQLCPGDPLHRSANLDRTPDHPEVVALPAGPAGLGPV